MNCILGDIKRHKPVFSEGQEEYEVFGSCVGVAGDEAGGFTCRSPKNVCLNSVWGPVYSEIKREPFTPSVVFLVKRKKWCPNIFVSLPFKVRLVDQV